MLLHPSFDINPQGHLTIAGVDSTLLAKEFGTPLYVLDEAAIREKCRIYKGAMDKYYGGDSLPLYAGKALCYVGIYKILMEEGMGVDVVSCGELYTAAKAGYPMEKIYFHGNNKSDEDLNMIMDYGVGTIVADSREELDAIDQIAASRGIKPSVMLRVTPGIDSHTHKKVITGNIDSKFGNPITTGQALELVRHTLTLGNINFVGIHCHIGSQIFEHEPFFDTASIMVGFLKSIKDNLGVELERLNLGGGFGVKYIEGDLEIDFDLAVKSISERVKSLLNENGLSMPTILIEPGRSIVADAGATLYTVGSVKTIPGYKTYVSINGGMTDNPRYALYQSPYAVLVANKANDPKTLFATIGGRCCESGDLIQEDVMLANCERGDILGVLVTGAYNYSMASNYNRMPRPAMVIIKDKQPRLAIRRESYEDLIRNDIID